MMYSYENISVRHFVIAFVSSIAEILRSAASESYSLI